MIDSLDIQFPEGLVIITGQTGAGKSILIGALRLALGAKADVSAIADGAETCTVEAEFSNPDARLKAIFEEEDGEWDPSCVIVRRVLSRSGRSRCFVNDCPASVGFLSRISSYLLDIHSQHQNLLLNDRRFQMDLLDYFAGNQSLLADYREQHSQLARLMVQIQQLEAQIASSDTEREFNQMQWERLDKASLRAGEMEELQDEQDRLSNAEQIKNSLCTAVQALSGGDYASGSVDACLRASEKELRRLAVFYPECEEMAQRMESARLEIEDISADLNERNDSFDDSSARLEQVQERLSLLQGLLRKYSCADEAELIALRDSLAARLFDTGALEIECNALKKQAKQVASALAQSANQLHNSRATAAEPLSQAITASIRSLELDYAVFTVQVQDMRTSDAAEEAMDSSAYTPNGTDKVSFLFSANGTTPEDVAKCASGGEMSRIMLSLKDMMARYAQMPTMIFDEIDSGVSGSVADSMGSMICAMGENMQVFAITHLPQVAAKGKAHYLVSKEFQQDGNVPRAVSKLQRLSAEERIQEVARMLSGSTLTPEAIENAKVLLH